jgi:hypothetical protein
VRPLLLLLAGIAVAAIIYFASSGHIVFLPLILLLPFGWFMRGRRR